MRGPPSALPRSQVPALHYKPGAFNRYPRHGGETQVWTVIFKTASVPASQHILRSPFPSFPPIEQSRCSIPPFERCKATPRSLLEHLVDRSKSHLSSLSRGFGLIFCALLCCSPHCSSDRNLLSTVSLYPYIPSAAVCRLGCPSSVSLCGIHLLLRGQKEQVRPSTDINTFFRPCDRLTLRRLPSFLLFVPVLPGLGKPDQRRLLFLGAGRC